MKNKRILFLLLFLLFMTYNLRTEYAAPQRFDVTLQVKIMEELIAQKVNGIAISAVEDAGLAPVIGKAREAGIIVITFDAPAPSSTASTYIGTDNKEAGYIAGKEMINRLGGSGDVAILQGGLSATNLNQRTEGFKKALDEAGLTLLTIEDTKGDFARTILKTEKLIENYPTLNGIFGVAAYGAPAAATVVKSRNLQDSIVVGGFDDLSDTVNLIKEGIIDFSIVQKTYKMGWLSIEKLLAISENDVVNKIYDTGVLIITSENVNTYKEDLKNEIN
jgi:ribose transport system substrate-binding protein